MSGAIMRCILQSRNGMRAHQAKTALSSTILALLLIFVIFHRHLRRQLRAFWFPMVDPVLEGMHRHLNLERFMREVINAVPDISFVLLAVAGLSYLIPELAHKLEMNRRIRYFLLTLFILFGALAIWVNAVNRADQEQREVTQSQAEARVLSSVLDVQQSLHSSKPMSEAQRRENISESLRDEYILTHNPIDPEILLGTKMPPEAWMNQKLHDLGETWAVSVENSKPAAPIAARSYIAFSGNPRFTGPNPTGAEGGDFQPGYRLGFNVHYRVSGSNPVQVIDSASALYIGPDSKIETQRTMVSRFTAEIEKERNVLKTQEAASLHNHTVMPGDDDFFTALGWSESMVPLMVTQDDLDKFKTGAEVNFVIAEITYKDNAATHHSRRCIWLQPPASNPGTWHFCEIFNHSD